jgi:murein L,D-transpeptidase YcbB/YkuD
VVAVTACERVGRREAGGDVVSFKPAAARAIRGTSTVEVTSALTSRLKASPPSEVSDGEWRVVRSLYETYLGAPLWFDRKGPSRRASELMEALAETPNHALALEAYPVDSLQALLEALRSTDEPTAVQLAEADVLFTSTFVALAHDLLVGQVSPRSLSQDWHIDPRTDRIDSATVAALSSPDLANALGGLRPQFPGYVALQKDLEHYRELTARGPWPNVPEGKTLKPGDSAEAARLQALRARLAVEDLIDAPADTAAPVDSDAAPTTAPVARATYDSALAGAVAEFQRRHGIEVDSALGRETVNALNVPVDYRLGQIAASLERYRWLPRQLGGRFIVVNVPAFRLEAYDGGDRVLDMKVIVGAEYEDRATPAFSDSMQYVVFRPYWNVPDSIAVKEIWPKIKADPGYMERSGFETFKDGGKTRLRRRPGEQNDLGLVKFLFPNDFNVYLHDTPQRTLFKRDVRAFSHGCIRVERPADLAAWVLGWPKDRVEQAMESGDDNQQVSLETKIPVYITYVTAYSEEGQLYFGNDLYSRDTALVQAVQRGAMPDSTALTRVAALAKLAR